MATVIQIKRSTTASAPTTSNLAEGELAYVQAVSYTHLTLPTILLV